MSNDHSSLASSDIMLLMENYQNIMQMNAILQQQQKQLIDLQNKLLYTQGDIVKTQTDTVNQINKIVEKMADCACNIQDISKMLKSSFDNIENSVLTKIEDTDKSIGNWRIDDINQHNAINKNVYITWGVMSTIVIGIIGLLITSYEKFSSLDQMIDLLHQLIKYFKLG